MASRGEHASGVDDQGCGVAPGASKFQLADSMAEWRSREQLEPSAPSTSPGYWDTDDDETSMFSSGPGPKPSDLYGKFTWKIENFSEISKRELRSNVFEVGGYKWYILVYPQGCDVCNHLSLFLCVADYDKLLPGWSHFAQFTIAVVNRDPKKSKYSDTLHRFCKKEHDWGWKKFMELSKVLDGFTVSDTLVIKAQVQVIRENPHRPFRCLDCQYRRELVRVYLTNVETICRRFVEEKREKLSKVIEDSVRWSSFRTFWSAVEDNVRRRLAREKTDVILKAVVKRFFNEKEVTSTLVMDALYSGCKALDYQNRNKKGKVEKQDPEESSTPLVWVEKDFFVLAGDILSLLEHAASESLPSYKDEKGPQNRSKDVCSGEEFGKEFVERDERRLTELGRRTIEMFVLAHLFSNRVEVAYREAVALKRQEELIREEEAAGQAESELKAKREAADKEKRSKKKQAKQRRKDRKVKDKDTSENHAHIHEAMEKITLSRVSKQHLMLDSEASSVLLTETGDEEGDLSGLDNIEDAGALGATTEDADIDSSRWGSIGQTEEASFSGSLSEDVRGVVQTGKKNLSTLDDSSSTCSSDSVPAHIGHANGCFGTHPSPLEHSHSHSRTRGRNRSEGYDNDGHLMETEGLLRTSVSDACSAGEPSSSSSLPSAEAETMISSLRERVQCLEKTVAEKFIPPAGLKTSHPPYSYKWGNSWRDREISSLREQVNLLQCKAGAARQSGATSMNSTRQLVSTEPATMPAYSRPSTAPILANGPRPSSAHPPLHPVPSLARTMSAAGRLNAVVETITEGLDASSRQTPSMALSYRNAAIGKAASPGYNPDRLPTSSRPASGMTVSSPHGQTRPGSPGMPSKNLGMSSLPTTPKHVPPYEQPRSSSGGFAMSEPAGLMANVHPDNDGMTPDKLTQHRCNGNKESVAITFGTVTQDVLHNEQQTQHEDCSQETGKTAHLQEQDQYDQRQFSKGLEQNQSQQHLLHSQRLQPGLSENGSSSITRQAAEFASPDNTNNGSSLSEGFPHLDIINDLLDDDKYVGRILTTAVHQNLHGQRSLPSLNGMLHVMEDREHKLLEACSQIQAMSSASYGLLPSSLQTDHSRLHDRYWALSRPSTPVIASSSPMLRNALDIHNRYPFVHSPQIVLSDNSGVSPGNDGYASFTSLQ